MADYIPKVPPIFQTSLATPLPSTGASVDIASPLMLNGIALSGLVGVSMDIGQPNPEYAIATLSGVTLTFIVRGISPLLPRTSDPTLVRSHRRGAVIKITDFMAISLMRDLLNGTTPFENKLSYLTHLTFIPGSFEIPDVKYVDDGDAATLATAEAFAIAYADKVAGLSSGIGGKPMTFSLPDSISVITPISVYMNKEALIFTGKGSHSTTIYLQDTDGLIMSRDFSVDWSSAIASPSACLIGGSFFALLTDGTNYRVYKYDSTDLSLGGTLVMFSGGSLGTISGLTMTTNGNDIFFNHDGANNASDNFIARYTVASTTFTYNSTTTMSGGSGYFDQFGVDDNLVYYGFSLLNQNISKWNSSGVLQYTSGSFPFVSGFKILNWGNTFYITDVNLNQDVIYVKLYVPGSDLTPATPITTAELVYGETIAKNDYLFQANGNESLSNLQSNAGSDDTSTITAATVFIGQEFTTSAKASTIKSVTLSMRRPNGTITGNAIVRIFASSGGLPTGAALGSSVGTSVGSLPVSPNTPVKFNFTVPVAVSPSTSYCFVLDTSSLSNFSGHVLSFAFATSGSPSYSVSSNSGTSYTLASQHPMYYLIEQGITAGRVYKTDITTPIYNMGPYLGFAQEAGISGETHSVQLLGIVTNLIPTFTVGQQVYIDPATPGGLVQTAGIHTGRSIGIAIGAHSILLLPLKRRGDQETYSSGDILNQDGFLMFYGETSSLQDLTVTESNPFNSDVVWNLVATQQSWGTVPVKSGYSYTFSGTGSFGTVYFYPLING